MYSFIYYYMVKLIEKKGKNAKSNAAGFVFFTQVVHIFFILTVFGEMFNVSYPKFSDTYEINKLCMLPFAFVFIFLVEYYYKKRHEKICKRFSGRNILTTGNAIIVFSTMLIPLLIMIHLLRS
jgi:hypothetical protein